MCTVTRSHLRCISYERASSGGARARHISAAGTAHLLQLLLCKEAFGVVEKQRERAKRLHRHKVSPAAKHPTHRKRASGHSADRETRGKQKASSRIWFRSQNIRPLIAIARRKDYVLNVTAAMVTFHIIHHVCLTSVADRRQRTVFSPMDSPKSTFLKPLAGS